MQKDYNEIWSGLAQITDPEIPVVTLEEMGILRELRFEDGNPVVKITPTFSGCPALDVMQQEILGCLAEFGYAKGRVEISLSPPWTTDWITAAARQKLTDFGISPPARHSGLISLALLEPVACPQCDSENTSLRNSFGSTPCRMIYTCNTCLSPFEYMKPL